MQGDAGDDVIIGQGNSDSIYGEQGDDLLVGDGADVMCSLSADLPQIINTFVIISAEKNVNVVGFNLNTVVARPSLIWPAALYKYSPVQLDSFLTSQVVQSPERGIMLDVVRATTLTLVLPDLSNTSNTNSTSSNSSSTTAQATNKTITAATRMFFAMVPDVIHHTKIMPGNDTIDGGDGRDVLVGDHLVALQPIEFPEGSRPALLEARNKFANNTLTSLRLRLSVMSVDVDTVEQGLRNVTREATIKTGNDDLQSGPGTDLVFGDYAILLTTVPSDSVALNSITSTFSSMVDFYMDVYEIAINLDYTLYTAHTQLLNSMFEGENERLIRSQAYLLGVRYVIIMGKDKVESNFDYDLGDEDLIVGDHAALVSSLQPETIPTPGELVCLCGCMWC